MGGQDSVVGTATDGPGIEPRCRRDFPCGPDQLRRPPNLLYNVYWVFPGLKRPGCGADHPPSSKAEVTIGLELHLRLFSGPAETCYGMTFTLSNNELKKT